MISEAPLGSIFGAVCGGHVADFMAYLLPRRTTEDFSHDSKWMIEIKDFGGWKLVISWLSLICLIPNKAGIL